MGQKIELKTTQFGKNVIFDLNRSLSGQDGETYHNIAHACIEGDEPAGTTANGDEEHQHGVQTQEEQ